MALRDPAARVRAVVAPGGVEEGLAIVRARRRGPAREAVLAEVLVAGDDARARRALVRRVRRAVDADYVMAIAPPARALADGLVPLPSLGPVLTWRRLATPRLHAPHRDQWRLTLGDIELF
jgi:hypothetical protein